MSWALNAVDFGMHPSNTAANNLTDLQAAIATAIDASLTGTVAGGTVIIPCFNSGVGSYAGSYPMTGPVQIGNGSGGINGQVIVAGSTSNVTLLQTIPEDLFEIDNAGGDASIGGTYFHDFQIGYKEMELPSGSGLDFIAGQNAVVERIVFNENPTGVLYSNILCGTARNCTFVWSQQSVGTGVSITGHASNGCNQIHVKKCEFSTLNTTNTYIAILIAECEHPVIGPAISISGLNQGILIQPPAELHSNVYYVTIIDVESSTTAAGLAVMPFSAAGSWVRTVTVTGCQFTQSSAGQNIYNNGGLYFDTDGGIQTQLDGVKLIGVVSHGWSGPGLQINAGQNFQIVGGTYAGNGQGTGTISAGHLISGSDTYPPQNITATGVDLSATYTGTGGTTTQSYALYISGNPAYVYYNGCSMLGYAGSPVKVTGSPTHLYVTNCPGYNDQNTPVLSTVPMGSTMAASHNYYGPSQITFSGGTTSAFTLNGTTYAATSGQIVLASPYDTISFTGVPTTFSWIGK